MDASVAKVITSCTALVGELDDGMAPFRLEMQGLLTQLQTSHSNQVALHEKSKALGGELDAARMAHAEVKQEEAELANSLKQLNDDSTRLGEEIQKSQMASSSSEASVREARAAVASLVSLKSSGSGWTGDQRAREAELKAARAEASAELAAKRAHLAQLRNDVLAMGSAVEAKQTTKIEADRSIASIKDEIADTKARAHTMLRLKDTRERELKEAQDGVAVFSHELAEKTKEAEASSRDLSQAQEALRRDKTALDRCLKEYDKLRTRAIKLAEELETQMRTNQTLATELNTLSESATFAKGEIAKVKKETDRLAKLHALCTAKVEEAEARRVEAETRQSDLKREIEQMDARAAMERRRNEVKKAASEDVRREKDVLARVLGNAGDKVRDVEEALSLQDSIRRNLQSEIAGYAATLKALRQQIDELQEQRTRYAVLCEEAQQTYFTAHEGVKLQELQMSALQRKIEEGNAKLKQQQALYDAVRVDRNMYSKNLADANTEIGEMRRSYKQLSHAIDSVKGDIESKDMALIKEHYEHHRVEKEKETLRNEVTRVQKQVQSCEQILSSQSSEMSKLNSVIAEADTEKLRQTKEYESVAGERNLLQTQLIKRDSELGALYEKLRVQKSSLANGAAAFAKSSVDHEDLLTRIAALKGELLVAETQTSDVSGLEAEAKRLEADLRAEKTKIRALTEELERPINIHRWRALADIDPERWALIQRMQSLQKRVLDARDEIRGRELAIADKEKEYSKLKTMLARQPGPDIQDTIASYQATVKAKSKQLRALEGELDSYRGRVDDLKAELLRENEVMEELTLTYLRHKRAAQRGAQGGEGPTGGAYAGAGSSFDESALLDVTAELAAAGLHSRGGGGGRPLPQGTVTAVKDEADRLLAAYADVLGDDEGDSSFVESKRT